MYAINSSVFLKAFVIEIRVLKLNRLFYFKMILKNSQLQIIIC